VAEEVTVAAVEWDVVKVIIQRVGIGMVPEMVLEMEQGQEKDLVIQGVDTGMARGMEPAQVTDLKMEPGTEPKKAMEPGRVTALAVKGKAEVVEIATDCT
jgi:hypothetical protein